MECERITWNVRARVNKTQKMLIKAYPPMMRILLPRDSMSIPCKKHTSWAPWTSEVSPSGIGCHEYHQQLPYSRMLMQWCIHRRRFQWSHMGFSQQGCRILWTSNLHRSKSKGTERENASHWCSQSWKLLLKKRAAPSSSTYSVDAIQLLCWVEQHDGEELPAQAAIA